MSTAFLRVNCSLTVSACLLLVVTAQLGGGGNTFRCCTKCPTSKRLGFLAALRRAGQRRDYSS